MRRAFPVIFFNLTLTGSVAVRSTFPTITATAFKNNGKPDQDDNNRPYVVRQQQVCKVVQQKDGTDRYRYKPSERAEFMSRAGVKSNDDGYHRPVEEPFRKMGSQSGSQQYATYGYNNKASEHTAPAVKGSIRLSLRLFGGRCIKIVVRL